MHHRPGIPLRAVAIALTTVAALPACVKPAAHRASSVVPEAKRKMSWRSHGRDQDRHVMTEGPAEWWGEALIVLANAPWMICARSLVDNLKSNGIVKSPTIERAMRGVDRASFVSSERAYIDTPQDIGQGQTISAPHMHAFALEELGNHLKPGARVLDVGSGSGYLTAVMADLVLADGGDQSGCVVGIDVHSALVNRSRKTVANVSERHSRWLEKGNIVLEARDGWNGYNEYGAFDVIHVGAAAAKMPQALQEQLKPGGRMVIPVGPQFLGQDLYVVDKAEDGSLKTVKSMAVNFVPLISPS